MSTSSDEERIRQQLQEIALKGSFVRAEQPVERFRIARELAAYADRELVLRITTPDSETTAPTEYRFTREELPARIAALRRSLAALTLTVDILEVDVSGEKAVVIANASGVGREPGRTDHFLERHRVRVELRRRDGRWLVTSAGNLPAETPP